jgi:hypothetical protein
LRCSKDDPEAGHYDSSFTHKTNVHASDEDLHRGQAAPAKIHKIA